MSGASSVASHFKVSKQLIGLTIVAFGTGAPELAVSISSLASGNTDMLLGNVIGSNILNILIILGLTAVICPIAVQKSTFKYEIPYVVIVSAVIFGLGYFDQTVSTVQLNSKVIITLVDSKFDKMDMTIEAVLPENLISSKQTFVDSFETQYASFESQYGVKPVITETDTGILVTIKMNGEQAKKYSGSSNLKTSREEVIKEFEKENFKCS